MKHLFLASYVLACAGSFLLAALLRVQGKRISSPRLARMAAVFAGAGLFMAFWYAGEYLILNVRHADGIPYACLEAAAILSTGAAAYFFLESARGPRQGGSGLLRSAEVLTALCALGLASLKFSQFLFGHHVPALYWVKLGLLALLFLPVIASSVRIVRAARTADRADPSRIQWTLLGAMPLVLPVTGAVDVLVLKVRFFEGTERLGMHYPLSVASYLLLCLAMILASRAGLRRTRIPGDRLREFRGTYGITAREGEILELILAGKSNGEIARALYISVATTKNHVHSIFGKAGLSSRSELITLLLSE